MICRLLIFFAMALLITGCTLAPEYSRPEAPISSEWPSGPAYKDAKGSPTAPTAGDMTWREFFIDEGLQKVIETALNNNRDLRLAALNVEMARAIYGIRRAELLPALSAVGLGSKLRLSDDLSENGKSEPTEQYSVDFGIISWEIDFFGKIRSLKDRALKEYLATEQGHRSARILLISGVANTYLGLAADRELLRLSQSTLDTQQAAYNLIKRRYEVGITNELDLRRAQTQVDTARADAARLTQLAAADENALNLLLGSPAPGELLPDDLNSVIPPGEVTAGMPSEVLLRRPDILQAEELLKAANANIGAARAAFFPSISLTASFGTGSDEFSRLFESGTGAWSYATKAVMPIFDARTWSALKATKVEREIVLTQYEKSIQTAFREVADALAVRGTVEEYLAAQQSLVNAAAETYRLSNARYMNGIDSYLGVLDAQRALYAAEHGLVSIRLARLTNLVRLYAVLGGGA